MNSRAAAAASVARTSSSTRLSPGLSGPTATSEDSAAPLSPLDRLVFDRKRLAEIFEYDYALEMYKPAAQRIWGYWALPVL